VDETIFLRLLKEENKGEALREAIAGGRNDARGAVHRLSQDTLRMIPGAPFAYWVSTGMRRKFSELPSLESEDRNATKGLATTDDFRFARLWYEVPVSLFQKWFLFAKGGGFSPYYFDIHLVLNWRSNGAELKAYLDDKIGAPRQWSRWINAIPFYFRPGLTWPNRTDGLSFRVMPTGCVFAHKGPALFCKANSPETLFYLAAILNSRPMLAFVHMLLARTELA
jgi:hypothetical protein